MSMDFNIGARTGASANQKSGADPYVLFRNIAKENPAWALTRVEREWWAQCQAEPDMLDAVGQYMARNLRQRFEQDEQREADRAAEDKARVEGRPSPRQQKVQEREQTYAAEEKVVKALVLMNLTLPISGKALRYSTFLECEQAGGWFAKVARLGKPNQVVGKTLTEEDLQHVAA